MPNQQFTRADKQTSGSGTVPYQSFKGWGSTATMFHDLSSIYVMIKLDPTSPRPLPYVDTIIILSFPLLFSSFYSYNFFTKSRDFTTQNSKNKKGGTWPNGPWEFESLCCVGVGMKAVLCCVCGRMSANDQNKLTSHPLIDSTV